MSFFPSAVLAGSQAEGLSRPAFQPQIPPTSLSDMSHRWRRPPRARRLKQLPHRIISSHSPSFPDGVRPQYTRAYTTGTEGAATVFRRLFALLLFWRVRGRKITGGIKLLLRRSSGKSGADRKQSVYRWRGTVEEILSSPARRGNSPGGRAPSILLSSPLP